jgi:hypothetical protein
MKPHCGYKLIMAISDFFSFYTASQGDGSVLWGVSGFPEVVTETPAAARI